MDWVAYWWGRYVCSSPGTKVLHALFINIMQLTQGAGCSSPSTKVLHELIHSDIFVLGRARTITSARVKKYKLESYEWVYRTYLPSSIIILKREKV